MERSDFEHTIHACKDLWLSVGEIIACRLTIITLGGSEEKGGEDWRDVGRSMGTQIDSPQLDRLFTALADAHRRYALRYLRNTSDGVATLTELIDYVANQTDTTKDDERERIAVALYHKDLPKLEATGLIEYDARSKTVQYKGHSLIESWLDQTEAHELQ